MYMYSAIVCQAQNGEDKQFLNRHNNDTQGQTLNDIYMYVCNGGYMYMYIQYINLQNLIDHGQGTCTCINDILTLSFLSSAAEESFRVNLTLF